MKKNDQMLLASVVGLALLVGLTVTLVILNRPQKPPKLSLSKYSCKSTLQGCVLDPKGKYDTLAQCQKDCHPALGPPSCIDNSTEVVCNSDNMGCHWVSQGLGGQCEDGPVPFSTDCNIHNNQRLRCAVDPRCKWTSEGTMGKGKCSDK